MPCQTSAPGGRRPPERDCAGAREAWPTRGAAPTQASGRRWRSRGGLVRTGNVDAASVVCDLRACCFSYVARAMRLWLAIALRNLWHAGCPGARKARLISRPASTYAGRRSRGAAGVGGRLKASPRACRSPSAAARRRQQARTLCPGCGSRAVRERTMRDRRRAERGVGVRLRRLVRLEKMRARKTRGPNPPPWRADPLAGGAASDDDGPPLSAAARRRKSAPCRSRCKLKSRL